MLTFLSQDSSSEDSSDGEYSDEDSSVDASDECSVDSPCEISVGTADESLFDLLDRGLEESESAGVFLFR